MFTYTNIQSLYAMGIIEKSRGCLWLCSFSPHEAMRMRDTLQQSTDVDRLHCAKKPKIVSHQFDT